MEFYARHPEPLKHKEPMNKTWKIWKQEFIIFMKVAKLDGNSSYEKSCFLLNIIGQLGIEAMQNMKFACEDDKQNYDILLQKFDEHFDPPKNEIQERLQFYGRSRKNNESIDDYIADLKEKVKTCNFGHLAESMIRDTVIMGIEDQNLRKIILEIENLDINKLIITYKQFELNGEQMKKPAVSKEIISPNVTPQASNFKLPVAHFEQTRLVCSKCGTTHSYRNCPAYYNICDNCCGFGHFTQRCRVRAANAYSNHGNTRENTVNNIFKDHKLY